MTFFAVLGVFAMVLFIGPSNAHRDSEGSSLTTSETEQGIRMNKDAKLRRHKMQRHKMQRHKVQPHPLQPDMESLEADCKAITDPDSMGIEALKKCVSSLEVYSGKVRTHEKKYVAAHGKYSNAFVHTYALLKSVLDNDKQLHKYRTTFVSNHTQAGEWLQKELANVKSSVDDIGAHWQERGVGADALDSSIPEEVDADAATEADYQRYVKATAAAAADFDDQGLAGPGYDMRLQAAADGHLQRQQQQMATYAY